MNILNGNTFYVDTQFAADVDDLIRKQTLLAYVTVTTTGANGIITLGDVGSGSTQLKLTLKVPEAGKTEHFKFADNPILFPNGIRIITLTNAVATITIKNPGG